MSSIEENFKVGLDIGNYYGEIEVSKVGPQYFLQLKNYDGMCSRPISESLALNLIKELGPTATK